MIEETIKISFDYQDFEFYQFVEEDVMNVILKDYDGNEVYIKFKTGEQIQRVIDNLYRQMRILKDAKENSTEA